MDGWMEGLIGVALRVFGELFVLLVCVAVCSRKASCVTFIMSVLSRAAGQASLSCNASLFILQAAQSVAQVTPNTYPSLLCTHVYLYILEGDPDTH